MASGGVVTLTLDEANAHDCKEQRVDQRHRQYQRQDEIPRFARRLRHLLIRDEQPLLKTLSRVTAVFQSTGRRATIARWPIGQAPLSRRSIDAGPARPPQSFDVQRDLSPS